MNGYHIAPEKKFLDAIDYSIFVGMLVISVAIGFYFAFVNKKRPNTTSEYLTGNKELSVFPIAMSLASSQVSGVMFLAFPAEVYVYGSQTMAIGVPLTISIITLLYIFIPVFCRLNILSSYEYLTKRFNQKVAILASVLYLIKTIVLSAATLYIPALTLSQLSGLKIEILIPILAIICIFYTTIGGLRAIVWADTLQAILMIIGAVGLSILGTYHVGGFEKVWARNDNSGRIEFFNFDPDPRTRATFWTVGIGVFFYGLSESATNQMTVQRCLALSTFKKIKMTMWLFAIVGFAILTSNGYNGLVAFAVFYDCDPVTTKSVAKADQIIPYLLMFLTKEIPALPGLFVSALFSASFSTISTTLNSMAGVFIINVVKPLYKRSITEEKATFLMKIMVIIFGCLVLSLGFLIDQMGGLFQVSASFLGLVNGIIFGMFILGMFFPRVSSKSVFIATLAAFSLSVWLFVGAQIAISRNQIFYPTKSFSVDGCDNSTLELYYSYLEQRKSNFTVNRSKPFSFYDISYQYYPLIAIIATVSVGLIVSYCFTNDRRIAENVDLYSPMVRKLIRTKRKVTEEVVLTD